MTIEEPEKTVARLFELIEELIVKSAAQATALKLLCEMCDQQYSHWDLMVKDTEERTRPDVAAKFGPIRDTILSGTVQNHSEPLQAEDWREVVRRLVESVDVDLSGE